MVAVGTIAGPSTTVVVAKYDHNSGERVWCRSFPIRAAATNGTTFLVPLADVGGLAIDSSGTIFIGGHGRTAPFPPPYSAKPGPPPPQPAGRYFATRCSSSGGCASTVTFIHPSAVGAHNDTIGGIAIGSDDNPVLTGLAEFPSTTPNKSTFKLLTVKVNGSTLSLLGTALASSRPPTTASSEGVAVDSSNDIFVTGSEASTLKYDSLLSPTPLWTRSLAGARIATPPHDGDEDSRGADDVGVLRDAPHDVGGEQGFAITRLNGETGVTRWAKTYGASRNDIPRDIAFDYAGNLLVAGNRGGHGGESPSGLQEGQLVSLDRTGAVNWAAVLQSTAPTAVAVGLDDDPVVSGSSEGRRGGPSRMNTVKYRILDDNASDAGKGPHERSDQDKGPHDNTLLWDQPFIEVVTGFRVCIDGQTGAACQDLGPPQDLHPRILPSTSPGFLTYEIALSDLTSFRPGRRRITVIAYNAAGDGPESEALIVMGRSGQHTESEHDHKRRD